MKRLYFLAIVLVIVVLAFSFSGESNSKENGFGPGKKVRDRTNRPGDRTLAKNQQGEEEKKSERLRNVLGEIIQGDRIQIRRDISEPIPLKSSPDNGKTIRFIQPGAFAGYATGRVFGRNPETWIELTEKTGKEARNVPKLFANQLFLVKY